MDSSSIYKGLAFGGIASCIAEVITLPMDTVKTRLQLQGELGSVRQYSGSFDAVGKIARNEGILAFWKGIAPALLRQATYGSMRYGFYTPIKNYWVYKMIKMHHLVYVFYLVLVVVQLHHLYVILLI